MANQKSIPVKAWSRRGLTTRPRSLITDHRLLITGRWPLCLGLLLLTLGTGCRLMRSAADLPGQAVHAVTPGKEDKHVVDPVEIQQKLLRFADEYSMQMIGGVDNLQHGTNALTPAKALQAKIDLGTETWAIAAGPNAVADLLDMTVFVTVIRMALEDYWQPRVFGESALPLLEYSRNAEAEIWGLAGTVLTPEQQKELRRSIATWHSKNPLPGSLVAARALGFAVQVAEAAKDEAKPGSVFSLLGVDPLAGMDPAVREIARTRLLAERALFLTQKMPLMLRWQTELLTINATETPAVQQLVSNSTQIAASVERFAAVAEKLPNQVSAEREEILKALQSQEKDVTSLMSSGTQFSASLNTTLTTLDALMKRFGVGDTNKPPSPPKTNAEPFRIQDYTQSAAQLEATARQLTELLVTLDRTIGSTNLLQLSAQVGPVVQQAQTSGKDVVNYAFWKGILLVAIALVAALIYRFLGPRLSPVAPSKSNPP